MVACSYPAGDALEEDCTDRMVACSDPAEDALEGDKMWVPADIRLGKGLGWQLPNLLAEAVSPVRRAAA